LDYPLSKSLVAEAYGTFVLVFLGTTAITVASDSTRFPAGASLGILLIGLAFGGALLAAMATVGAISGGHFNPAVTIAMFSAHRISSGRVLPYILAQLAGATAASLVQLAMVGTDSARVADLGSTLPNASLPLPFFAALLAEIVGTLILAMTFLGSTDPASAGTGWGTASIGVSLSAVIFALGAVSGASLNPARSFGPALVSLYFDTAPMADYWVYLVGPILGGLLAANLYIAIFKTAKQPEPPKQEGPPRQDELPA
jgi:glycerol uptake facilitator protein